MTNYKSIIAIISGLILVVGTAFGVIEYFDRNYASANDMQQFRQSVQKDIESKDLEILKLRCEIYREWIKELEKDCLNGCSLDKMQRLEDLKEAREQMMKKIVGQ